MHNRIPKFFVKEITKHNACFGEYYQATGSIFELPFDIDYIPDDSHDFFSCENCLSAHASILKKIETYFETFPLCCSPHSKLLTASWFKKVDFINLPMWVADKSLFTNHFINTHIDKDDWKVSITNYIDYAVASFGSFPEGYGEPVALSKFFEFIYELFDGVAVDDPFPDYKYRKNFILNFIKELSYPKDSKSSDFNLLASTYDRWCKLFPFDLPIFAHLKSQYYHTLPFLSDTPIYNPYLGLSIARLQTKERLIEHLIQLTSLILDSIDTNTMIVDEYIIDSKKYTLDLIKKNHQIDQSCLLNKFTIGEQDYIKTLKSWYKNEQSFLAKIRPILNDVNSKQNYIMKNDLPTSSQSHNSSANETDCIKPIINDSLPKDDSFILPNMDFTYQLADDFLDKLSKNNKAIHDFHTICFKSKGYVWYNDIFDCTFFNLQLCTILICQEPFDAFFPISNQPVLLKGSDYLKTYKDAFNEGVEFFDKTYNFDLYHPNTLVETIKLLYFPKDNINIYNRKYWSFVTVMNPFIISHEIVKDYGYNSGLIYKVHKLIEIHPILFKDFYNNSPIPTPPALFPVDTPIINTDISKITVLTDLKESNNNSIFNTESIDLIHNVLKSHFVGFEDDLLKALNGDKLDRPLFFKGNQNQLTEFFLRAKYNNLISCTKKEIENWLCSNFSYKNRKNIVNLLNASTVWDVLTKPEKGPTKLNRICISEDFPYKPTSERSE